MIRHARLLIVTVAAVALLAGLAGCFSYKSNGPLVDVGGYGTPKHVPSEIPPGPEHQVCRDVAGSIQHDLEKTQDKLKKAESDRDRYKAERDDYKKQLDRLRG